MLIINKAVSNSRFILTLTEANATAPYVLVIDSAYDNDTNEVQLGTNISSHPERYDEFLVSSLSFSNLMPGKFNYSVKDASSNIIERGILMVVDDSLTPDQEVDDQFISITPSEDADDFVVYNNQ